MSSNFKRANREELLKIKAYFIFEMTLSVGQVDRQINRQIDSLLITDLQLNVELYDYLQKIEY